VLTENDVMNQADNLPEVVAVESRRATIEPRHGFTPLLGAVTLVALYFVFRFAFPYMTADESQFGIFKMRREWLLVHIAGGTAALLLGPLQLWLVLEQANRMFHRILGVTYVTSVAGSSVAAFYLAWHTDFGWVFAIGFTALATAWVLTTTLAVAAICKSLPQQHAEWMIRSYVVTFAFVTFRILAEAFEVAQVGTITERLSAASWLCWSVPLLITESILQGRKIFSHSL
jgi:hypothetical protein